MPARIPPTKDADEGFYSVIIVTCFKDKGYHRTRQVNFMQRFSAYECCDKFQDEIDAECAPARAYVIDKDGVPIRCGRTATANANWFFTRFDHQHRTRRSA